MRRLLLLCLAAALLAAPAATAATTTQILRDCQDDGVLEGHYTVSELRKAARHLPTDVAEYTDCGDVLSRAIDAAAADTTRPSSHAPGSSGGGGGASTPTPTPTPTPAAPSTPATPKDSQAIAAAARSGPPAPPGAVHARPVAAGFAADIHRNSLPSSLLIALILIGAAAVALVVPALGRVVSRRRT